MPIIGFSLAGYISVKIILSNFDNIYANSDIKSLVLVYKCG